MDRDHLESGDGLHEDQRRLQALLRRANGDTAPRDGREKYRNGFDLTLHESALEEPLRWKKPRLVFVNSMSDLFHESVPAAFIESCFRVMNRASQHTFQVLTKRCPRHRTRPELIWTTNIWLGTSIESKEWLERLAKLKETNAHTKFLSLEPLLRPLPKLDLAGIDLGDRRGLNQDPVPDP